MMRSRLGLADWEKIIDNVAGDLNVRRFNLAGGEPLASPFVQGLIDAIHDRGYDASIITNGLLLNQEFITRNIGKRTGRHKMGKHFAWKVEDGNFTFSRKKTEKTAESGLANRTWRGMIAALGTLCRTTIPVGDAKVPVVREGTPDAYQSRVFELLVADAPTWPRRCAQ